MPDVLQRVLALGLFVFVSPVVLVAAIAIRLDSPGSPIYRAVRVGACGRHFTLLKLRTMRIGAVLDGPRITTRRDARVTRVGHLIRARRLDELPQLWNVVRGEMRLVGPRPEDPEFVDLDDPVQIEVLDARPGITGLAQLVFIDESMILDPADPAGSYRRDLLPQKLALDTAYLRNRSTRLDLRLLWLTVVSIVAGPRDPATLTRSMRQGR